MAKKAINIICGKCKLGYAPDNPYLIKHLFNYKNPEDSNSYYKVCKRCLGQSIKNWFDYENILKAFEDINVPFIERLWHESISLTNVRLLQSNNNVSAALPSIGYGDDIEDNLLVIITLFDEYFKKARQSINQQFFFNKGIVDSIQYMDSERESAEKLINDSIKNLELQEKQAKQEKIALLDEDLKNQLLDDFGYFKVDLLSDSDYIYLSKKWGLRYNNYELVKLEEYWIKAFQSFEIITSTHQDLLLKIAKISLEIDNAMEKNEWDKVKDLTKLMKELMDSAQFTPKSKSTLVNRNFLSSIAELVSYIEKRNGFIPRFDYKVRRDIIDATIENLHNHTQTLVRNEINLADIAEAALIKMQLDKEKEKDNIVDDNDSDDNDDIIYDDDDDEELIYNNEELFYSNDNLDSFMNSLRNRGEN